MAAMQKHKIHEPQRIKISTLSYHKYRSSILYLHHYTVLFIYITIQYSWFSQKMSFCLFTSETFFFSTRAKQPSTIKEKISKPRKEWIKVMLELKKNEKWKPRSFHMILIINVKFGFRCYLLLAKAMKWCFSCNKYI